MAFWNRNPRGAAPKRASPPPTPLEIVRAYHERTKHGFQRYATGPLELDWATQPDPFRRFAGAPEIPLALPPAGGGPDYGPALVEGSVSPVALDASSVSRLLYDSLAISAWKEAGASRWALRVNPSSGNLHPTEGYLLLPAIAGIGAAPGVYHYAPREHLLERRAVLPAELWDALGVPAGGLLVALSSIHWREAWKYGERAFRYCQHDVGHAIAAVAVGAAALGWRARLIDGPATRDVGRLLGLGEPSGPEAEYPDGLLALGPEPFAPALDDALCARFDALPWSGAPNELSPDHVEWEAIELAAEAAARPSGAPAYADWERPGAALPVETGGRELRAVLRGRRSGVAFDGRTGMDAATFFRVLEICLPRAGRVPFATLPWSPRIHLAIFVHRVEGLDRGLYWLQRDPGRDPGRAAAVREACREEFLWHRPADVPDDLPLSLLLPMDLRGASAQVSCGQAIAGDGAFSLGMIADFERSLDELGAWSYPRMFWEAGAIGQALYLEAEAVGLRATGIGCYFDDPMHSILGLRSRALQSLYHFTVGRHVDDPRISSRPAYPPPAPDG